MIAAVGATFDTTMSRVTVVAPPSLSVTVRVTVYVPLSRGVKANVVAEPPVTACPLLAVTDHA